MGPARGAGDAPRRSHDGEQLRRTARMIALAGNLTGDNTLLAIALMAQLVALAAPSPSRARPSSTPPKQPRPVTRPPNLQAAVAQARSRMPRFGHAQARRSARGRSAAENARQDFPTGLSPTQAAMSGCRRRVTARVLHADAPVLCAFWPNGAPLSRI
jgi:hypothetical protein